MTALDAGLLLLGLTAGLTLAAHGAQKAFGWFGGPGMHGWTGAVAGMGFYPAAPFAAAAMLAELAGGLGLALGLLTPFAAAFVVAQTTVIIFHVHWHHGFWNTERGIEYPLLIGIVAVFLGLVGRGTLSVDGLLSSPLLPMNGALRQAHSVLPPLTIRMALLLAGAVIGSLALAEPRLARMLRSDRRLPKRGATR
jgi:putative oxidoreductase